MKNIKKIVSIVFTVLLIVSSVFSSGAAIYYEDTFDDFNEEFWVLSGSHFATENGVLCGWDDAVAQQSYSDWSKEVWGAFKTYTAWIDVRISDEAISEPHQAGIWYTNIYDYQNGLLPREERYKLMYCGDDSTVYFYIDTARRGKKVPEDGILASLKLEGDPGMNINGDPVRLGLRVEEGKITAYANGSIVGEHSHSGIGLDYSATVLWNDGCYVEFDNFAVGDLEENVAVRTRPYDYVPETYALNVTGGTASAEYAEAGESVTVTAEVPEGKVFECWEIVSGEGVDESLLKESEFTFEMPSCDIELRAILKDDFTPGDADGDGFINARDVILVMKASLPGFVAPDGYVEKAADMDGDKNINARDVIEVMKAALATATEPK